MREIAKAFSAGGKEVDLGRRTIQAKAEMRRWVVRQYKVLSGCSLEA